jgi:hypothetical protein
MKQQETMTRTIRLGIRIAVCAAIGTLLLGAPSQAQTRSLAQRMTGPAPVVYNWAGSGQAAASVMANSRMSAPSVRTLPRLQLPRLRFELKMFTPQYWSRASFGRR